MTNPNDSAFPAMLYDEDGNPLPHKPGLTKREYAAIQIEVGLLACPNHTEVDKEIGTKDGVSKVAVRLADALLAELGREK